METLQQFDDTDFDIEKIESLNLVRKLRARETAPIKILAKGGEEFKKTINIKANSFSKTAKELIEKNGGKAEVV